MCHNNSHYKTGHSNEGPLPTSIIVKQPDMLLLLLLLLCVSVCTFLVSLLFSFYFLLETNQRE